MYRIHYSLLECLLRQNNVGGIYDHGRRHPQVLREHILNQWHDGLSQSAIAQATKTSTSYVQKVVDRYDKENISIPVIKASTGGPMRKIDRQVLGYLEVEKLLKPSIYASELRDRLLLDGVVNRANLPSNSQINKRLSRDLLMTKKHITQHPVEANSQRVVDLTDDYLWEISQIDPSKIHFFDESSVIKTTCNRTYGSSTVGCRAIEVQRYSSNANYTVNLLMSCIGVDYFNILEGPSNGMELLNFFEDSLQVARPDGSAVLEMGDVVVMDNCGFHHGHFVEPLLRNMLTQHGIRLIFQPPYSPHLNPCEQCFNQMKSFLKREQRLANEMTKIAIAMGLSNITANNAINYFRHSGYLQ